MDTTTEPAGPAVEPNPFSRTTATVAARRLQHRLQARARNTRSRAGILGLLNSAHAFNLWPELIMELPGYDEDGTLAVDHLRCEAFVADGLVYRWNRTSRLWQQIGAYPAVVSA